jgi:hypothetical protein
MATRQLLIDIAYEVPSCSEALLGHRNKEPHLCRALVFDTYTGIAITQREHVFSFLCVKLSASGASQDTFYSQLGPLIENSQ